ncbi:hypothetical protein Q5752_001270 [Cryptotrichosporon argae]
MSLPAPAPDASLLRAFALTHILYDPVDPLGVPLTLLSLSPIFLFVALFTLLVFTRRLSVLLLTAGQVANEILSLVLKDIFAHARPDASLGAGAVGYGMPSSHSQAAGFLCAWGAGFYLTRRRRRTSAGSGGPKAQAERVRQVIDAIYMIGLAAWSVLVAYSRWHLSYHTPLQIVVGYGIGLGTGAAYFHATEARPLARPGSVFGRARGRLEWAWRGLGGVGGHGIGAADGGWGEGWVFVHDKAD